MDAAELLKRVRKIEIKTRHLSRHIFAGEYHSAFKGRGIAFSEVREYQYGDDIRTIDWNVTARFNHPYVKVFEEERELTVMLLIDVSGSRNFGSRVMLKRDLITEVAAVLAFSAIQNNDKVGVIFFSDRVEKFIPPKKNRKHILHIIRELLEFQPESENTDFAEPLRYLTNAIKKRSIAFVISDFIGDPFRDSLRIASNKHDIVALQIFDKREREIPQVGLLKLRDAETGEERWVDTASKPVHEQFESWWKNHDHRLEETFLLTGVDNVRLSTDEDYIKPLVQLFKKR
ncbi:MAG: DUF58 domain-containing protein [Chlorobi bacterium]|nr:DUF58 domain-containing protein [Chlorobiota bacterium]